METRRGGGDNVKITTVAQATEHRLPLGDGDGLDLWYRTWGNRATGTPVLFVHGGPGQCVADYDDINARFFDADKFFVVEVDQRGTGRSRPSVRDDLRHMEHYTDVSIGRMSEDFEAVREALGIESWLVFGGSWGSTLGLDYGERHPTRCRGLILRGIYLNTAAEFDAIYARSSFAGNDRRLAEFDAFLEPAVREAQRRGEPPVDPDGAERVVRLYDDLIRAGDREAIWRFYVFENNIITEDPSALLDPRTIVAADFPEAASVAFFEARLFLRGTFEEPTDLLGRVPLLRGGADDGRGPVPVPTWVVQGTGDEICPEKFARLLTAALGDAGVPCVEHFVDAGHKASSDGIAVALRACVDDFYANYSGC